MALAFRNLFDALISALGGGYDKPPQLPKTETGEPHSFQDLPISPTPKCCVCGVMPAQYLDQYCSHACMQRETEQDLADRMDAWHDQFQERFGDD
jgi:hypothetical protein